MRKLIAIEHLEVGMFVDAEVVNEEKDGDMHHFLQVRDGLINKSSRKRARLKGGLPHQVTDQGGVAIASEETVEALRATGLSAVTIDTQKGKDLPLNIVPLTDPKRESPPGGRIVHFDEEVDRAKEIRGEATETMKEAMENIASGKGVDIVKIQKASTIITESIMRNLDALVSLTRIKQHDPYTAMHSINVCTLVVAMVQSEGVDTKTLEMITTAVLLHDIGKTRIPLDILNKPGKLEFAELTQMRRHAEYGGDILREVGGFAKEAIAIATQHHEMMDGSGYPLGLKGDEIHPLARLTAVADVYDALTAKRVYKEGMPLHQALLAILKNRTDEFDDHAVKLLVKTVGFYPVSSLVLLSTGELALVYQPNPDNPYLPIVGIFTGQEENSRSKPFIVDLSKPANANERQILKVLKADAVAIDIEAKMQEIEMHGIYTDSSN